MSEAATWTVRQLKIFLHSNGISTAGMKEKTDLITLATDLQHQQQQDAWIKVFITILVIAVTALLFNTYIRPKVERYFWINPKWIGSWLLIHSLWTLEKLLSINIILSWIVPSTLSEYNLLDKYLVQKLTLFPLYVPLNFDSQTGDASMWLNLYPMCLIWVIRKVQEYWNSHYHYFWYDQFREGYYEAYPDARRADVSMADMQHIFGGPFQAEIERIEELDDALIDDRRSHGLSLQSESDSTTESSDDDWGMVVSPSPGFQEDLQMQQVLLESMMQEGG